MSRLSRPPRRRSNQHVIGFYRLSQKSGLSHLSLLPRRIICGGCYGRWRKTSARRAPLLRRTFQRSRRRRFGKRPRRELDLALSEVRTPAPILPDETAEADEPAAAELVDAPVGGDAAAVQKDLPPQISEQALEAHPPEPLPEPSPPAVSSQLAPQTISPLAELSAFADALAGDLAPAVKPEDQGKPAEPEAAEGAPQQEKTAEDGPVLHEAETQPPATASEPQREAAEETRRRPPLPRDLDAEPEPRQAAQRGAREPAVPRNTGVLSKIEKAVRREAARRAQSGEGPTGREPDPRVKIMLGMDENAKMAPSRQSGTEEIEQEASGAESRDVIDYDPGKADAPPPSDSVAGAFARAASDGPDDEAPPSAPPPSAEGRTNPSCRS